MVELVISDGCFRIDGAQFDETDGSRIIQVTKDSDIPKKYTLNTIFSPAQGSMQTVQHQKISSQNFRLIETSWGKHLSSVDSYGEGILCLVTFTGTEIDGPHAKQLTQFLEGKCRCEGMRYDKTHLLLHFDSIRQYSLLGEAFLNKQLDDCMGSKAVEIEPSKLVALPRCMVEVNTTHVDKLQESLTRIVLPFSSEFHFIVLRNSIDVPTFSISSTIEPTENHIPNMCLTMLFAGNSQRNALHSLKEFRKSPWQSYELPEAVLKVLDDPVDCFIHGDIKMPMLALKTGCPQSGVQLTVFVKEPSNFAEMQSFYEKIIGKKPLDRKLGESKIHYCIFACSNHSELLLASYPDVDSQSTRMCSLHIQVKDVSTFSSAIKLSTNVVYMKDPEGNRVVLFTTLK